MNYSSIQIVLQEVPGEISICFAITGCELKCKGCHSPFLWKKSNGKPLTEKYYQSILKKYLGFASCVLFMGGEWHKLELTAYLKYAQSIGYKTCLYTGEVELGDELLSNLTWVKTGAWVQALGGLESPQTNQKFIEIKTNKNLSYLFTKNFKL